MKRLLFGLVLVAGLAHAGGVALFTEAPLNKALAQKYQAEIEWADGMTTVKVNPRAIDSSVITATVGGKNYRFIGTKTVNAPVKVIENGKAVTIQTSSWIGVAGDQQVLILSGDGVTAPLGTLSLNGDVYELMPGEMLIKRTYTRRK